MRAPAASSARPSSGYSRKSFASVRVPPQAEEVSKKTRRKKL